MTRPDFSKMTKEELAAHKAAYLLSRTAPVARQMTAKDIKKMEARNRIAPETTETHYEMLRRNTLNNLPSSMR